MQAPGLKLGQLSTGDINVLLPTKGTPVNAVAAQGKLTIGEPVTADDTITIGLVTYTFKTGATYAKAQGTLSMATKPTADDTVTIGTKVFTFKAAAAADGDVAIGADVAASQAALVAAINGTDGINTAHTLVTAAAFAANEMVVTAILPGTDGNSIASTETFTDGTDAWDATTLGTTTAGALLASGQIGLGGSEAATKLAIVAAINGTDNVNSANALVSIAAFSGDDAVLTARTKGVAGNAIVSTETFTHASNILDATTLGTETAGVDGTVGQPGEAKIDATYLYYCVDENPISGNNWRRVSLGSAY